MKRIYIVATLLFWVSVGAIWANSQRTTPAEKITTPPAAKVYSLQAVAAHNRAENCWMAINGQVYDLSAYIPQHPSAPEVIVSWCGKEATNAYMTKNRGRPHSAYASELLARYRIGVLEPR